MKNASWAYSSKSADTITNYISWILEQQKECCDYSSHNENDIFHHLEQAKTGYT